MWELEGPRKSYTYSLILQIKKKPSPRYAKGLAWFHVDWEAVLVVVKSSDFEVWQTWVLS